MKDSEIEEMKQLRRRGLSYNWIAKKLQHSPTTVRKYCKDVEKGDLVEVEGGDMLNIESNPLSALKDMEQVAKMGVNTGISLGGGLGLLNDGFTNETKTDKERLQNVVKGSSFLGSVAFSAMRTLQELSERRKEGEETKTVKSPDYGKLEQKLEELKDENEELGNIIEGMKKRR